MKNILFSLIDSLSSLVDKLFYKISIFWVYIEAYIHFRKPLKASNRIIVFNNWIIEYKTVGTNKSEVEKEILDVINGNWASTFQHKAVNELADSFGSILKSSININRMFRNKDEIFFLKLKLQPFSEYITEQRNLQIKNLLNEE